MVGDHEGYTDPFAWFVGMSYWDYHEASKLVPIPCGPNQAPKGFEVGLRAEGERI